MPPIDEPQPSNLAMNSFTAWLKSSLDNYTTENLNLDRVTIRRLNLAKYKNSVRGLLEIDVDFHADLPADNSGYGFDNIADISSLYAILFP